MPAYSADAPRPPRDMLAAVDESPDPRPIDRRRWPKMPALQEELLAPLDALQGRAGDLFAAISQRASLSQDRERADGDVGDHFAELQRLDGVLAQTLQHAAEHAGNQQRIEPLVASIRARDTKLREAVSRCVTLRDGLRALTEPLSEEREQLEQAEASTSRGIC